MTTIVDPKAAAELGRRIVEEGVGAIALTQLGVPTTLPTSPVSAVLERIQNKHGRYVVRFTVPEFTSLCPVTGQPDFAKIVIDYVPDQWLVESKSLKLFMGSFRNHGAFHEDCTATIGERLMKALEPLYLRVGAYWFPRGGIPIDVFWEDGQLPRGMWLPDQGVPLYGGR